MRWLKRNRCGVRPYERHRRRLAKNSGSRLGAYAKAHAIPSSRAVYHVTVDDHAYSVPNQHKGREFEYRLSTTTLELFMRGRYVATHRQGLTAYFIRVPLLTEEFTIARAAGKFKNYLAQLVKFDLLVLDDWGIENFSTQGQHDIFELIDARVGPRATIITSQSPIDSWHDALDNKIVADAILDRVAHSSHSIRLKGESLRKKVKKLD